MSDYPIKVEDILNATDGGLQIILYYYPQAEETKGSKRNFKATDEKTASARLREQEDGIWTVTNWGGGGDGKQRNGIAVCMLEEGNISFLDALKLLAARYHLTPEVTAPVIYKPEWKERNASVDEKPGWYDIVKKNSFSDEELATIFSKKILEDPKNSYTELAKICYRYSFFPVESFSYYSEKTNNIKIKISTPDYPIFVFDHQTWVKVYEPKAVKAYRFRFFGSKPESFVFGLEQCRNHKKLIQPKKQEGYDEDDKNQELPKETKIPEIILCTGGSDGLNVAAMGYQVIWMNSESEKITGKIYTQVVELTESFLNLPDLDATGKKEAHKLAMIYLDLRTIQLPEELLKSRDQRGNPCKDVRDYFRFHGRKKFADLLKVALPYRFWDEHLKRNKDGEVIIKYGRTLGEYKPNTAQLHNFIVNNGFYRHRPPDQDKGWIFIRVENNVVTEVEPNDISDFINQFLIERHASVDLRNAFLDSTRLNDTSLSKLPLIEIGFKAYDKTSQYLFFKNKVWRITAEGIEDFNYGSVSKFVWKKDIIQHIVTKLPDMFEVNHIPEYDDYSLKIVQKDCMFMNFLIQTSRIHWRKDLETELAGKTHQEQQDYRLEHKFDLFAPNLDELEQKEQELHMLNKIYAFGYYMHAYKNPSEAFMVFDMDSRVSEDGLSYGGSGKSLASQAIYNLKRYVELAGTDKNLTKNPHVLEEIDKYTEYVLIDDADKNQDFRFFYPMVTGAMKVNPKGLKSVSIKAEDSPKIRWNSNFTPQDVSSSTMRRLLFCVYSDYYHYNTDDFYKESRDPVADFGINLFRDFSGKHENQWNLFLNFAAQACRLAMQYGKINPPMNLVDKRNQMAAMGENFLKWADVYFSEQSGNRDKLMSRKLAFDDFVMQTKATGWLINTFSKKIKVWCRYRGLLLDPVEMQNSSGRIIRNVFGHYWDKLQGRHVETGEKKSAEMIYVQTPEKTIAPEPEEEYMASPGPVGEVKF